MFFLAAKITVGLAIIKVEEKLLYALKRDDFIFYVCVLYLVWIRTEKKKIQENAC